MSSPCRRTSSRAARRSSIPVSTRGGGERPEEQVGAPDQREQAGDADRLVEVAELISEVERARPARRARRRWRAGSSTRRRSRVPRSRPASPHRQQARHPRAAGRAGAPARRVRVVPDAEGVPPEPEHDLPRRRSPAAASDTSSPFRRSRTVRPAGASASRKCAPTAPRGTARSTSRSIEAGIAAACDELRGSRTARRGGAGGSARRCSGVTAEARFTTPGQPRGDGRDLGSGSARRTALSGWRADAARVARQRCRAGPGRRPASPSRSARVRRRSLRRS